MEKSIKCTVFRNPRKVEDVFVAPVDYGEFSFKNHVIFCQPSTADPLDRYVIMIHLGDKLMPMCLCLNPDDDFDLLIEKMNGLVKHWSIVFKIPEEQCYSILLHTCRKIDNYVWKPYQLTMQ